MKKIFVIGAGVNGLSSAVKIAEHFYRQNVQVILVSEDTSPNTTGDLSAGLWGPYLIANTPEEKIVYVFRLITQSHLTKIFSQTVVKEFSRFLPSIVE